MKENTHPEYRDVCFLDMGSKVKYICGSTVVTKETIDVEGKNYPCVKVSISSSTHPFFTGDTKFVDTEGRVDKFKKKYAAQQALSKGAKKDDTKEESKKDSTKKQK